MGVLQDHLWNALNTPEELVSDCQEFFAHNVDKFEKVLHQLQGGKYVKQFVKNIFEEIKGDFEDPDRGIKAVVDLGIPINKYKVFAEFNKVLHKDTSEWKTKTVHGVPFPNIWPSYNNVWARYKEYRDQVEVRPVSGVDFHAGEWSLNRWLEHMITSPFYKQFLPSDIKENELEVIIRGDSLKKLKKPTSFLIATLGNFGLLSKSILFNSVVNLAQISDKKDPECGRKRLRAAMRGNLDIINQWIKDGYATLADGTKVKVRVELGGDENWLRALLNLKEGSCESICLHCYATRAQCEQGKYNEDTRQERTFFTFRYDAENKYADHVGPPLVEGEDIWSLHYCIMHGTIPFGKDLLGYFYDQVDSLTDAETKQTIKKNVDEFLQKKNIHVSFVKGPNPIKKTWNVKATETHLLLKHFDQFCAIVDYQQQEIKDLVAELIGHLRTLYKWKFSTQEDWDELEKFERDFPFFIEVWRDALDRGDSYRNYYHTLSEEVPRSIRIHGSAWKYSSDITETYVCSLKQYLLDFTNRGGLNKNPCVQAMNRYCLKMMAMHKGFGSAKLMISPWEEKKLCDYLDLGSNKRKKIE